VYESRPERHSQKPAWFYDVIEQHAPGPYLELFARTPRPGWTSVGLDLGSEVDTWLSSK